MTYKINGTDFLLQPTTGQWLDRELLGMDGNGRPIYSATRNFEVRWGAKTTTEFNQLKNFFDSVGTTGSLVVDLPMYGDATWQFESYTGCFVREPTASPYFQEHYMDVHLLVTNIRTA